MDEIVNIISEKRLIEMFGDGKDCVVSKIE